MRNQIVSWGNHWIMVLGKSASVSRHWFELDYFHQYLETIDGVLGNSRYQVGTNFRASLMRSMGYPNNTSNDIAMSTATLSSSLKWVPILLILVFFYPNIIRIWFKCLMIRMIQSTCFQNLAEFTSLVPPNHLIWNHMTVCSNIVCARGHEIAHTW